MAFDFDVIGWEDRNGDRHEGKPSDINDVYGEFVHAFDSATGEHKHFWAFVYDSFEEWEEWLDYIEQLIEGYGLSVA